MAEMESKSPHRPKVEAGQHIKAKEILEEERITHTQHLEPRTLPTSSTQKTGTMPFGTASPTSVEMTVAHPLRIGVIGAARVARKNVGAITNPVSLCSVAAVASRDWEKATTFIEEWCKHHDGGGDIVIKGGEKGYDDLINSQGLVDAVYIPLPTDLRKEWVLKSLEMGKHVLIEFPVSMTVGDYLEMIDAAKKAGKFLMDGTMFMHHHRLEIFLEHVSSEMKFGKIMSVDAEFCVMSDDKDMDGHVWPSEHDDPYGCIGSLGWYCVRFGLLVFTQVGLGTVRSVQVTEVGKNDAGHPMDAKCCVTFDKDHLLTFHCSFVHHTRQRAEVRGDTKSATIYDFAFPHHAYTSYQVQGKATKDGENHSVKAIDTIECGAGPPQEVMMWRTFSQLSRGIDQAVSVAKLQPPLSGSAEAHDLGWGDSPASKEAIELSAISVQTQVIIDALMESIRQNEEEITLPFPEL